MKILITSDLHANVEWYGWLARQAPNYAAIIVAGDLLDMTLAMGPQVEALRKWVRQMAGSGTHLFLCDGNHERASTSLEWPIGDLNDFTPNQLSFFQRACLLEHWPDALIGEGATVVSGMVKRLSSPENLIVTSLYYGPEHEQANFALLRQGAILRRSSPKSLWIVLSHEPPVGLLGTVKSGNPRVNEWIEEFNPTIVCCGHDHRSPLVNKTCFERIGLTSVFNAGFRSGRFPYHIILETTTMEHVWKR